MNFPAPMMRLPVLAAVLFLFGLSSVPAQLLAPPDDEKAAAFRIPLLDRSALHPERRLSTEVEVGERNPFGVIKPPVVEQERVEIEEVETEEMKIRRVLANTRVSGVAGPPGARTVLLGSLVLQTGQTVPRLFANQAEVLRVAEVTEREVKFVFQDRDASVVRSFSVAIDLEPRVSSLLYGELLTNTVEFRRGAPVFDPVQLESVSDLVEVLRSDGPSSFLTRPTLLMGNAEPPDENTAPTAEPDQP